MKITVWILVLAVVAPVGCAGKYTGSLRDDPASAETAPPGSVAGGGPMRLPTADRGDLDLPLRAPESIDDVGFELPEDLPCMLNASVENDTLQFAYDSAELAPAGVNRVVELVDAVLAANDRSLLEVIVIGHASLDGEPTPRRLAYDQDLSERRARIVATIVEVALARNGIAVPVHDEGRGVHEPVAENSTEDREANRRVEVEFHYTGCPAGENP